MASLTKIATTSATSSFFTKLLHHPKTLSASLISRLTTHRSASTFIFRPDENDPPITVEGPPRYYKLVNKHTHPFQFAGQMNALQVDKAAGVGNAYWLRVSVPGVAGHGRGIHLCVKHSSELHFEATAEVEVKGEEPRKYKGFVDFKPHVITSIGDNGILFLADGIMYLHVYLK